MHCKYMLDTSTIESYLEIIAGSPCKFYAFYNIYPWQNITSNPASCQCKIGSNLCPLTIFGYFIRFYSNFGLIFIIFFFYSWSYLLIISCKHFISQNAVISKGLYDKVELMLKVFQTAATLEVINY